MAGLLGDVLPFIYGQSNRLKRHLGGLLSDPMGSLEQTAGGLLDSHRTQQGLLSQAMPDPKNPFKVQDKAAMQQAAMNMLTGPLGFAPVGMNALKSGMADKPLDYQIDHKPMTEAGGAARLHDLTKSFGDDIYGPNALQYFGSGDAREKAILKALNAVRGKPDAMVTIYRGVPDGVSNINAGDWVTLDPRVAADYGRVVKMQVPASHITGWSDSLLEFGYHPPK